ncbi:MAG: hypothetical protein IJW86_02205 [Clostridia bacterium]|nr:hypothetical protein [Clostridia bacterium]
MKLCKKTLSVILTMLILVSCVNVCFAPITAHAATNNTQLKSAFQAITNTTNLTSGDGTLLNAADALYDWISTRWSKNTATDTSNDYHNYSVTTYSNNSVRDLNSSAKSAVGSSYNTLIDALLPTSGVVDDSQYKTSSSLKTGYYSGHRVSVWDFDTGKLSYKVTSGKTVTKSVSANLENILLRLNLSEVPSEILLKVTYTYTHSYENGYEKKSTDSGSFWNPQRRWDWLTCSWHYLTGISRTVNSKDTAAYKNLHAFNDHFIKSGNVNKTIEQLSKMTATEISALITANNTAYAKLNSYSQNVKNHFFDMDAVDTFMANCLFAQKVINALPAIDALNNAMKAGYDTNNLEEMENIYTTCAPHLNNLNSYEAEVLEYVGNNFAGYDNFSLTNSQAFMVQLAKDIELYKLREIKAAVDALRAQYPDAAAIALIDTDADGNYINDNANLSALNGKLAGYIAALKNFKQENIAEVFTDGTTYLTVFKSEVQYEIDLRGAKAEYGSYYEWFIPLVYDDLTQYDTETLIGEGVAETTPNLPNAEKKDDAFDAMYTKYTGLIGADTMESIFGEGENALGYIIDDYIARLYDVILARLTAEVDTAVGYYDAFGEVNFENFVAVKEAIGRVETNIWDYINKNNPSIISSELRSNYNKLSTILVKYNQFIASDGLADHEQKHLHDENGVFVTRYPTDEDKARVAGENYDVTEEIVLKTIEKLDDFLTSNDFTELVDIDQNPDRNILLSDFIKEVMAENFYTNDFVNMLMGIVYPAIVGALEDVYSTLPPHYDFETTLVGVDVTVPLDISYDPLRDIVKGLGLGIYPNQVDDYIASGYGTAKTQLSKASTWDALKDEDGNLTLDWGIDSIVPENYASTTDYLTAKKSKFLGAMAESFDAILPLVQALLADNDSLELFYEEAGGATYTVDLGFLGEFPITLKGDLTITANGCPGYSNVVVPILEAIGCNASDIKNYNTVKGYTTSRQFVDAIFNPIINFVENKLANAPVDTVASILPNLAYAIPFDKLWDLIDKLNIDLNYLVEDTYLGINVIQDTYPIEFNTFLTKDTLELDFDISSFSSIIGMLLSSFMPGLDVNDMPILNSGEFITYAKLNKNATTKRTDGKRINFEADKADVFMAFLNYLVSCLGDEEFVKTLMSMFVPAEDGTETELTPELKDIITNIYTNPDLAIAAIIELLNQTEYALEDYSWYDGSVGGTVEGITPAALVYLSHTNNWTKDTADYVDENLTDIINSIMTVAGSEIDLSDEITKAISGIYTNANVTAIAKALGSLELESKIIDIVKNELGVDLSEFQKYAEISDDTNWGFEDGDTDAFIDALLDVLSPLAPLYGFLLSDESLTLFNDVNGNDLVTFYGNEGYDNAIVPLLEALGCDVMSKETFDSLAAEDTLKAVIYSLIDRLDKLAADPINEILDILPGALYYIASDGISTTIRNLLHPIYVIFDTLRPIYNIDLLTLIPAAETEEGEEAVEIDIENIGVDTIVGLIENATGLNLSALKTLIYDVCTIIGTKYTSASAFVGTGKKGAYTEGTFDRADMITVIISYMLEMLEAEGNAEAFDALIGAENFTASLLAVFNGTDPETKTVDWMYYFGEEHDFTDYDFDTGVNIEPTIYAVTYPNNWTESSAAYLNDNLDDIVSQIVTLISEEKYTNLADMLSDSVNIYTTENAQAIADGISDLLKDIDKTLLNAADTILGVDFAALDAYVAPEGVDSADEFTAELVKILGYVDGIVNWLLFGEDYAFFTGTDVDENGEYVYNDIITIKGAEGYKNGIALMLEALGCENLPDGTEVNATELILNSAFARLDDILSDPANKILEVLPNVIYFLNADGLTASLYNTLSAAYALIESLSGLGAEININDLIGIDLNDLSFVALVGLIEEATDLDLTPVKDLFGGLCVGTIKTYQSVSGEYAYKMSYNSDLDRKDMLTLIITVFIQVIELGDNEENIKSLFGEDVYTAILNILNLRKADMQEISYMYKDKADTDFTFSAMESSELYADHQYGPLYTEEMAQYIADNIDEFIDNIIYLLGIEIDGITVDSLKELLNTAINGSLYNSKNAQAILDAMLSLTNEINALDGAQHIKALIKTSIGVDLDAWSTMSIPQFEDDRTLFTQTICQIITPIYPVLKWALCNEDFSFFTDEEKNDLITLLGAEGYAYGIIPLLEVLGCENILTPDAYYAAADADENALLTAILNPLFDRLDAIMAQPADEILEMLPAIIYFINSNGLDTCFKNALNAVYTLLGALEPLVEVDLYELIGVRLDEVTFESLFEYAIEAIKESTGYEFTGIDLNTIAELTVGKLVSYESANGKTAYKMVYQSETAKAEMVTIIMRLLITFLMTEDNRETFIGLLKDYLGMNEEAEKYVRGVLHVIAECTTETYLGMDKALATVYYLFYGTDIGVGETADGVKDLNSEWQKAMDKLKTKSPTAWELLDELLGSDTFEDVLDTEEGLAPNGFIAFFKKIAEWFRKIADFFKNLF